VPLHVTGTMELLKLQLSTTVWILLKQRWWGGNGISWFICKSCAPCSRQITVPTPHHCFYGPDALLATQPTASEH